MIDICSKYGLVAPLKVKKCVYDAKLSDIESKYFAASDYNNVTNATTDKKITEEQFV